MGYQPTVEQLLGEQVRLWAPTENGGTSANVLARYQEWRRFDTATLAVATDAFNRLFSNDNGFLRLARDIGMGITNAIPGIRRGLIREAAGLTGDLPRLAQGRPL